MSAGALPTAKKVGVRATIRVHPGNPLLRACFVAIATCLHRAIRHRESRYDLGERRRAPKTGGGRGLGWPPCDRPNPPAAIRVYSPNAT